MNSEEQQAYHKHITDTYDARSGNHDNSEWHRTTALKLIEEFPPRTGDCVLDIGTGTGTIAFQAASLVGPDGKVTGIDLSAGMLFEANKILAAIGPAQSLNLSWQMRSILNSTAIALTGCIVHLHFSACSIHSRH